MQTKTKAILTAIVFTIVGFMLNPQSPPGAAIWGEAPEGGEEPTGAQIGMLMLVALVEAIAFGIGIAFIAFGRRAIARMAPSAGWALAATLVIAWSLVSWVPHSAMHQTNGDNMARLIVIEYLFHVTLIASAVVLVLFFVKAASANLAGSRPAARSVAAATAAPVRRA